MDALPTAAVRIRFLRNREDARAVCELYRQQFWEVYVSMFLLCTFTHPVTIVYCVLATIAFFLCFSCEAGLTAGVAMAIYVFWRAMKLGLDEVRFRQEKLEATGFFDHFNQGRESYTCWVAVSGDTVVGHVTIESTGDRMVRLARLGVSKEFRCRGVGSLLVTTALEHARKTGNVQVILDFLMCNDVPRKMYERLGFKPFIYRHIGTVLPLGIAFAFQDYVLDLKD